MSMDPSGSGVSPSKKSESDDITVGIALGIILGLPVYFIGRISTAAAITVTILGGLLCLLILATSAYKSSPNRISWRVTVTCVTVVAVAMGAAWNSLQSRTPDTVFKRPSEDSIRKASAAVRNWVSARMHIVNGVWGGSIKPTVELMPPGDALRFRVTLRWIPFESAPIAGWERCFMDSMLSSARRIFTESPPYPIEEIRGEIVEEVKVTLTPGDLYNPPKTRTDEVVVIAATFPRSEAEKVGNWDYFITQCRQNPTRFFNEVLRDVYRRR